MNATIQNLTTFCVQKSILIKVLLKRRLWLITLIMSYDLSSLSQLTHERWTSVTSYYTSHVFFNFTDSPSSKDPLVNLVLQHWLNPLNKRIDFACIYFKSIKRIPYFRPAKSNRKCTLGQIAFSVAHFCAQVALKLTSKIRFSNKKTFFSPKTPFSTHFLRHSKRFSWRCVPYAYA